MNSRAPISSKNLNVGYRHTRVELDKFTPTTHWLVVKEGLERVSDAGVIIPDQPNAVIGTVLALGPEAEEAGVSVGDNVIYEAWMGGRWAFTKENKKDHSSIAKPRYEEIKVLLISLDHVWVHYSAGR